MEGRVAATGDARRGAQRHGDAAARGSTGDDESESQGSTARGAAWLDTAFHTCALVVVVAGSQRRHRGVLFVRFSCGVIGDSHGTLKLSSIMDSTRLSRLQQTSSNDQVGGNFPGGGGIQVPIPWEAVRELALQFFIPTVLSYPDVLVKMIARVLPPYWNTGRSFC
ncbi:hypothetical protein ABZP36_036202 [Zizania latifolia]